MIEDWNVLDPKYAREAVIHLGSKRVLVVYDSCDDANRHLCNFSHERPDCRNLLVHTEGQFDELPESQESFGFSVRTTSSAEVHRQIRMRSTPLTIVSTEQSLAIIAEAYKYGKLSPIDVVILMMPRESLVVLSTLVHIPYGMKIKMSKKSDCPVDAAS